VRAVADLIRQGKVRYFGLSNFRGWRIAEVVRICDQLGIDRPVASEPLYNLVDRTAEVEQLPAAGHYGLASSRTARSRAACSPASTQSTHRPPLTRAGRGDKRIQQTEWRPGVPAHRAGRGAHAEQRGTTSVAFALAWVLKNRLVSATIAGPRTEAQWDSYLPALQLELGDDDEKLVDSLVPPGHASTPGYTDPGYPVEGRLGPGLAFGLVVAGQLFASVLLEHFDMLVAEPHPISLLRLVGLALVLGGVFLIRTF
jgi:aryl-alcohol dehydrogenase-like predicted oxidoreductase